MDECEYSHFSLFKEVTKLSIPPPIQYPYMLNVSNAIFNSPETSFKTLLACVVIYNLIKM